MNSDDPKIHLRLNDKNDPACKARPTFNPKYVTEVFEKVTCSHCKKIVNAIKKNKTGLVALTQ